MRAELAYYPTMRSLTPVVAVLFAVILAVPVAAQINGVPPSVTSYGFGGQPGFGGVPPSVTSFGFGGRPGFGGVPPSVTSLGAKGFAPGRFGPGHGPIHQPPERPEHNHRRHDHVYAYPYFVPYYPVMDPYAYGGPEEDQAYSDQEDESQYRGGPTVFDRRGNGTSAIQDPPKQRAAHVVPRPPESDPDPPEDAAAKQPALAPAIAVEPNTVLVFKDGHKQEVGNYAIVGSNLFDLTPGHRQKISLADLDVAATEKANDDNGVDFKMPSLPAGT